MAMSMRTDPFVVIDATPSRLRVFDDRGGLDRKAERVCRGKPLDSALEIEARREHKQGQHQD